MSWLRQRTSIECRRLVATLSGDEEEIDLFRAGLLVARLDNEEVDVDAYCRELRADGRRAGCVAARRRDRRSDKLAALRKYLFDENGFHGSRGDYYNRANSYLNEVLDDREGLPITLSVVYMELARRIGLKIDGVGLPGTLSCGYVPAEGEPQLIDVFDGATAVSREEANQRVKEATERELADSDLEAATKRAIVVRMLQNLLSVSAANPPAMHRYLNAMLAIDPDNGQYHWLRAIVRFRLEDRAGATKTSNGWSSISPKASNLRACWRCSRPWSRRKNQSRHTGTALVGNRMASGS